MIRLLV